MHKNFNRSIFETGQATFKELSDYMKDLGTQVYSTTMETLNQSILKEFSDYNRYFIFKNRSDVDIGLYQTELKCKKDLENDKTLQTMITTTTMQQMIRQTIELQRQYYKCKKRF